MGSVHERRGDHLLDVSAGEGGGEMKIARKGGSGGARTREVSAALWKDRMSNGAGRLEALP